ncbi:MAG TPA: T9SS type A sorting domain-containing protein [Chitinophagales bacterium]|nr:T9SS type A sorting domain-containing protein [Chitinophagales bacterium]
MKILSIQKLTFTKSRLFLIMLFVNLNLSQAQEWLPLNSGGLNVPYITHICRHSNTICVLTDYLGPYLGEGTLSYFNGNSWQISSLPDSIFGALDFDIDSSGDLLYLEGGTLIFYKYNGITWEILAQFDTSLMELYDIMVDPNDNVWLLAMDFSSEYKVLKYDGNTWQEFDVANSLSYTFLWNQTHLVSGLNGNIFIEDPQGLFKFNGSVFDTVGILSGYHVYGIAMDKADPNGKIWVLAQDTFPNVYLANYDGNTLTAYNNCLLPGPYYSFSETSDDNGNIWLFSKDSIKLIKFDGSNLTTFQYPLQEFPISEADIVADNTGRIWIAVSTDSLHDVLLFSENGFAEITGNVFFDLNQNGIPDNNETGVHNIILHASALEQYCNSDSAGNYSFHFIDSTQEYTLEIQSLLYWNLSTPSSYQVTPQQQPTSGYNFGMYSASSVDDLQVTVTSTRPRLPVNVDQWISYRNIGTISLDGYINYSLDPKYIFLSSIPAPDSIAGNILSFNFSNLSPFEIRNVSLNLQLSNAAMIGDSLSSIATVYPISSDQNAIDNVFDLKQEVVGSYDPNEKTVEPSGDVAAGNALTYTIFFQNTGNDTAFNVVIRDTLDADLDPSTFELLGYSSPVEVKLSGSGDLEFDFQNILLPDSNVNEPGSHGFVKYKIRTKENLPVGTEIRNRSSICFDFNAPIVTNTTQNFIGYPDVVSEIPGQYFMQLYPNPSSDVLMISFQKKNIYKLEITDVVGRIMFSSEKISSSPLKINISYWANGMYFVSSVSENEKYFEGKFLKQ